MKLDLAPITNEDILAAVGQYTPDKLARYKALVALPLGEATEEDASEYRKIRQDAVLARNEAIRFEQLSVIREGDFTAEEVIRAGGFTKKDVMAAVKILFAEEKKTAA